MRFTPIRCSEAFPRLLRNGEAPLENGNLQAFAERDSQESLRTHARQNAKVLSLQQHSLECSGSSGSPSETDRKALDDASAPRSCTRSQRAKARRIATSACWKPGIFMNFRSLPHQCALPSVVRRRCSKDRRMNPSSTKPQPHCQLCRCRKESCRANGSEENATQTEQNLAIV